MPRRLSDQEWIGFQNSVDIDALNLPPWGAVVQWGQQLILVYVCPGSGTLCQQGEVMLSDVTDRQELFRNVPKTYDSLQEVWLYHVTAETIARTAEVAKATLETTGKVLKEAAKIIGETAGGLAKPLLEDLYLPLIVIALIYLFGMPSRR